MSKSKPRVVVTRETETGRNITFRDIVTGRNMNREQFVRSIENGRYQDYHVRVIDGVDTPASNPDNSTHNNLG